MRRTKLALLGTVGLFAWTALRPSAAQDDSVYWFEKYPDALREAKRTGKPMFVEFRCEP
jgi:hypothetical protein